MTRVLTRLARLCVHHRLVVLLLTALFALGGLISFQRMVFDAFPDLTNVQVQVLTTAPGLGAEDVERLVTLPVERSLGGAPGVDELRSLSRPGVSNISVVFEDGTDPWRARQIVAELVAAARSEIPPEAGTPVLGPRTTGLGEVLQFTVRSDSRSPTELYRLFELDIAPRLRVVEGVVEVNAWGAGSPQLELRADPYRLAAVGLTLAEVQAAAQDALAITSGGDLPEGPERVGVRAVANPLTVAELAEVVVRDDADGVVRLGELAELRSGAAPPVGLGTADGEGEALFAVVQLLADADALRTVRDVRERLDQVRASLPEDIEVEVIYDREKLVGSTLGTVGRSLTEGGLLVVLVLLVLLGDLRAGLVVASIIPLSLLGAFTGLYLTGTSGNLMSLGAIDFGLVVDGTIVLVESIVGMSILADQDRREAVVQAVSQVGRPVLFAVLVLVLVYLPVLTMVGTEGKLFRPMAMTVLFALSTALVLSFTYVPAVASLIVHPKGDHQTALLRSLARVHAPALHGLMSRPRLAGTAAGGLVLVGLLGASQLGLEFVPRLEEGDLVVQTARLPSINASEARREASRVEAVLGRFPEVERVASRTGSPALATDPMGLEEADILVRLAPRDTWTTADSTAGLAAAFGAALERDAPGPEFSFTQPIEMRFNELLEGVPSDLGVHVHGRDLAALEQAGAEIADALRALPGAADVKAPAVEGTPGIDVVVDTAALARLGVQGGAVHSTVQALQRGLELGAVQRGLVREPVLLRLDRPEGVDLVDLPVVTSPGVVHTLGDLAAVDRVERPALVRRKDGSRRVTVLANVRGEDLGAFMEAARAAVAEVELPPGTWLEWSGQMEQLRAAALRTAVTVPLVLGLIFLVLRGALGGVRPALLIFLNVPAATTGGVLALLLTGQPLSMSAVVGFIALFGVAVMNGVVLVSRTQELHHGAPEHGATGAARQSALERFRPVLMTALVAGLGFLPMAVAQSTGAEVQRPLATVVIGGLLTATPLTLLLLPALYPRFVRRA